MHRPTSRVVSYAVSLICVLAGPSLGFSIEGDQDVSMSVAKAFTIESEVLGEERQVLVNLPRGYEDGDQRYPVLILLDGSPFMAIYARASLLDRGIPGFVIAAVPNVDRLRDLSHENIGKIWPTSGGADAFLSFLTDELAPWIDSEFRTTGYRVITGGSAAGRFSVFALLKAPDTFDAAVARSPALGTAFGLFEELVESAGSADVRGEHFLYLVYGSHDYPVVTAYTERLVRLLGNSRPSWLKYGHEVIDNTGHFQFSGINAGMQALYADHEFPTEGFLLAGPHAVDERAQALSMRFKTDVQASDLTGERELIDSANGLGRQRRFNDAIRVLDYGIELHPGSASLVYYKAQMLEHSGRTAEAIDAYNRVFEMEPSTGIAGMTIMLRDNLIATEKSPAQ